MDQYKTQKFKIKLNINSSIDQCIEHTVLK
jgi:hypothetical protein